MMQFACRASDATLNAIRTLTVTHSVTQAELLEIIFSEPLQLSPAQLAKLREYGENRNANSRAVQRALKAIENMNPAQRKVIVEAVKQAQNR